MVVILTKLVVESLGQDVQTAVVVGHTVRCGDGIRDGRLARAVLNLEKVNKGCVHRVFLGPKYRDLERFYYIYSIYVNVSM